MTLRLTQRALLAAQQVRKTPAIVIEFDGINERFGSATIFRLIRIGDEGLLIGNDWRIGGSVEIEDQTSAITFSSDFGSTSSRIDYKLIPDRGVGSSVSSMSLAFVDDRADKILTVFSQNEMLGRKCKVWLSPNAEITDFPEDYVVIFRGIVDSLDAAPGGCILSLSHPDSRKRQAIFPDFSTELTGAIDSTQTTGITLDEVTGIITPITGPDGNVDQNNKLYIQIDDELIRYTGLSGNTLTGVSRAQLGTVGAAHDAEANVKAFYRLEGSCLNIALKLMLSGWNGPFVTGVESSAVQQINPMDVVPNAIFFYGRDLEELYGITIGDYVTSTGFADGANNFSDRTITSIVETGNGTYIVVSGAALVTEGSSTGTVSFRSKWDSFADGLKMSPDEVDVARHEFLDELFLSGATYDIYIKAGIDNAKEFLEQQIYSPIACYSVPRRTRSSVGYHIPPLPTDQVPLLNVTNIKRPSQIVKKRSTGKNFYNTIIYKFDEDTLTDKLLQGKLFTNATSRSQIAVGTKALVIEAGGLRSGNIASTNASRRLQRYAFAAEYFSKVQMLFKNGYNLEVGDIVVFDGTDLAIPNFETGLREGDVALYEIVSKSLDLRTGDVELELTNTGFGIENRYGLISPASFIRNGISGTQFVIQESFSPITGQNEFIKWQSFRPLTVRVRSEDYATEATGTVLNVSGNTITLSEALPFTPSPGMLMEFSDYVVSDTIKLVYVAIGENASGFSNGDLPYSMI